MVCSLIYVSQSRIEPAARAAALDDIQTISIARNTGLDITGLLIASPHRFAQLLEGPRAGVEAIMASIANDPRHHEVCIVARRDDAKRQCPRWRMARFDRANFGKVHIDPLLEGVQTGKDGRDLDRLRYLFAALANELPHLVAAQASEARG